jgi:ATP-binding cassette, subfamily B, bacterial
LDVRTEERVTDRLREVLRGTTTLIVAHRPSTVAMADRVALLHQGRVVDVGTHTELLARSSIYASIMKPTPPSGEELMDAIPADQHDDAAAASAAPANFQEAQR